MAETEIHKWPLPNPTDTPNVPEDMATLAGAMDGQVPLVCTAATRPAPVRGLIIYESDTKRTWQGDGAKWQILAQPWVAYTPAFKGWSNLGASPVARGEYCVHPGGMVAARMWLRAGAGTVLGTGALTVTLPLGGNAGRTQQFGEVSFLEGGPLGGIRRGIMAMNAQDTEAIMFIDQGASPVANPGNAGIPWYQNSEVHCSMLYASSLAESQAPQP